MTKYICKQCDGEDNSPCSFSNPEDSPVFDPKFCPYERVLGENLKGAQEANWEKEEPVIIEMVTKMDKI